VSSELQRRKKQNKAERNGQLESLPSGEKIDQDGVKKKKPRSRANSSIDEEEIDRKKSQQLERQTSGNIEEDKKKKGKTRSRNNSIKDEERSISKEKLHESRTSREKLPMESRTSREKLPLESRTSREKLPLDSKTSNERSPDHKASYEKASREKITLASSPSPTSRVVSEKNTPAASDAGESELGWEEQLLREREKYEKEQSAFAEKNRQAIVPQVRTRTSYNPSATLPP